MLRPTVKVILTLLAIVLLKVNPASAAAPVYTGTFSNQAVSGYDTVAYFTAGKPVKGKAEFKTEYQGAEWRFASADNLAAFKANPEKYAPQYGGYCAYAVGAKNALVSSDPEAWSIVNGKLYLNYDKDVQQTWVKDQTNYIKQADANWPGLVK
jgi:YHS domain-containing protein